MKLKCHWAMAAVNYKNKDRICMCPRQHSTLSSISNSVRPTDFFNNVNFTRVRKQLFAGEWPDECKSCKQYEDKGYKSYRQKTIGDKWSDDLLKYYDEETGEISNELLEYVEVRFSNACNLSCLHCSPEWSSKWQSILRNVDINKQDIDYGIHNLVEDANNQSWSLEQVDLLTHDLIHNCPNLKYIDVAGGEPLYQKQFWRFLENMQSHPNVGNIKLICISNFNTPVNYEKLSKLFLKFNKSKIRISVDGGKNIYNYFRSGTYDNIVKNIQVFTECNNKTIVEATNTISIYQLLDIENVLDDMLDLPVNNLHHSFVQYPEYLGLSVIPNKQKILDKLEKYNTVSMPGLQKMIKDIRYLIENTACDSKNQKRFIYYTNRMDQIKNRKFEDVYGATVEEIING